MKKILSLAIFAMALVWTWKIINSQPAIEFETHASIQQKFAELIVTSIQTLKPAVKDIQIKKLWTENMADKKVKAIFVYTFSEPADANSAETVAREIQGEAILTRQTSEDPSTDNWKSEIKFLGDQLSYQEGSVITPDNAGQDEKEPSSP